MSTFLHGHGPGAYQFPAQLGQTVSAASLSVVLASDYTLPVTLSSSPTSPIYTRLTNGTAVYDTVTGVQLPASLGTKTSANSLAVVLASDQASLPVSIQNATLAVTQSGTWNVGITNATLAVTQSGAWTVAATQSGNWSTRTQDGAGNAIGSTSGALNVSVTNTTLAITATQLPATIGAKLSAASLAVVVASDSTVSATQSGTWTFSCGQLPAALGQTTMANSLSVTIASNQASFPTSVTGIDYNVGAPTAQTQRVVQSGRAAAFQVRQDYSVTNVTTAAYVTLVAATGAATTRIRIFDSSGSALILATGAAASEVPVLYIPPGGSDSPFEVNIAAGVRLSLKALDANATVGQILISAFA